MTSLKLEKKDTVVCTASFVLPAFIFAVVWALNGVYPGGVSSPLIMDMNTQYINFFAALRRMGEGGNLFFSWAKSMGTDFYALYSYYLSSPLSYFVFLFSEEDIVTAVYALTILKVGLSGLAMTVYMRSRHGKMRVEYLAFSTAWALSGYVMAYSLCVMWLDAIILMPLILVGVDRIIKGGGVSLFTIFMTLMLVSNYYTGFMVFLGAFLYFILRSIGESGLSVGETFKRLWLCALGTIFSLGLSAVLIVPTLLSLMQSRLDVANQASPFILFEPIELITRLMPGVYTTITTSGAPSVFVGVLTLFLCVTFYFSRRFKLREKLVGGAILLFLVLSFLLEPLNLLWHGFASPNWFPHRFAFVFSFFLLYFASRGYFEVKLNGGRVLTAMFLVVSLFEMTANGALIIKGLGSEFGYVPWGEYEEFSAELEPLLEVAEQDADGEFYRLEKDYERTKNDAMALGYNGVTHYSSTYSAALNEAMSELGLLQRYFWNGYYGHTPMMDALFAMDYYISVGEQPESYERIAVTDKASLYKNPYALGLLVVAEGDDEPMFNSYGYENQEALLRGIVPYEGTIWTYAPYVEKFGENVISVQGDASHATTDGEKLTLSYEFEATATGPAYMRALGGDDFDIRVNGNDVVDVSIEKAGNFAHYIGDFAQGDTVTVELGFYRESGYVSYVDFYCMDEALFAQVIEKAKGQEAQLEELGTNHVRARVQEAQEGDFLYTSIPYSKAWKVQINGEDASTFAYGDAFLAIYLHSGENVIELSYVPLGFEVGLCISIGTAVLIIVCECARRRANAKKNIDDSGVSDASFIGGMLGGDGRTDGEPKHDSGADAVTDADADAVTDTDTEPDSDSDTGADDPIRERGDG